MFKQKHIIVIRIFLLFFAAAFTLLIFLSLNSQRAKPEILNKEVALKIGDAQIYAETADANEEIVKGLSGRRSIEEDSGMYFVLKKREIATFWMKGMLFSLDIIWIDDEKIIGIVKDAPTPTDKDITTYTSPGPVTHVLEVNAGFAKEHNIKIGDRVEVVM